MSLWNDFWDFVEDTVDDVGDTISDAWTAVKNNPIGAITSVVAMSYGIPPVWAGALGGAAGTAAAGGSTKDIIKASFTGAAMGQVAQYAGTAAASYGPIAQAAAAGTASGITGAILTGQDVLTAAKAGLVMGTVSGGIAKFMTPQEAVAQVKPDTLADIYKSGQDPLGTLIDKMGWSDSDSARASASEAFSRNAATTREMLMESVPTYVLKDAAAIAAKGGNVGSYIADTLGWADNGMTNSAAQVAYNTYSGVGGSSIDTQKNQMVNSGLVDKTQAEVLTTGGYTPKDLQTLTNLGYTAGELVDMASIGVTGSTLTSLAATKFPESTITSMLQNGASINDISMASNYVNMGKLSQGTAEQLVNQGFNASEIRMAGASSGLADKMLYAKSMGLSNDSINLLNQNGWDLDKISNQINNGYTTANDVNKILSKGYGFGSDIQKIVDYKPITSTTVAATELSTLSPAAQQLAATNLLDATDATILSNAGYTANDVKNLVNLGYTATDLADLASTGITANTLTGLAASPFNESVINDMLQNGASANSISMAGQQVKIGNLSQATAQELIGKGLSQYEIQSAAVNKYADKFLNALDNGISKDNALKLHNSGWDLNKINQQIDKGLTTADEINGLLNKDSRWGTPIQNILNLKPAANLVDIGGGNYMDQAGNITDATGKITQAAIQPGPANQVASAYTAEQEATYNKLIASGMSPAEATTIVGEPGGGNVTMQLSGVPAYLDAPSSLKGPLPAGTELATTAEANARIAGAYYDPNSNAWVKPIAEAVSPFQQPAQPQQPITPIVVPPTVTPAPVAPAATTPATQPAGTGTITNVAAPGGTLTYSNNITANGTNYKIDHYTDGSVRYTDLSNGGVGETAGQATTNGQQTKTPIVPPITTTVPTTGGGVSTGGGTGGGTIGGVPGTSTGGTGTIGTTPSIVTPPTTTTPQQPPLSPPGTEVIPEQPKIPEVQAETPTDNTNMPTDTTTPTTPIVPIVVPTDPNNPTGNYHYGTYKVGDPIKVNVPTGLNPGWIAPTPYYQTTSPNQAQYFWGSHPYQPGPEFNAQLYNTVPAAPSQPWGSQTRQTSATPQQILQAMGMYYPLVGSTTAPVRP